jgi:23S rRNA (uridine2552-2'-O)-methyltransferase
LPIEEIEGVDMIKGDIRLDRTIEKIRGKIMAGKADVVLCDAAPNMSGSWSYDHARSIDLATCAFECAKKLLKNGGSFAVKVFQGDMFPDYLNKVRGSFGKVQAFSPEASRAQSAEIYVIGEELLTDAIKMDGEYEVTIEDIGANGDGIAKVNDFVVFVNDVQKGDKLNIRIRFIKPNFAFGDRIA